MRRTKEESLVTHDHLLKVALSIFSEKGYLATTLEDIAGKAGVTRGAIYWHFKNKADIYYTLVKNHSKRVENVVQEAVSEGGDFLTILGRVFTRQLALIETDTELRAFAELRLFKTEMTQDLAEGRLQQVRAGQKVITDIAAMIRMGIEQNAVRDDLDPLEIARAFLALQNGLIQLWLLTNAAFSMSASASNLADVFINGIKKV